MKFAPLLLTVLLASPANAWESVGDRSNYEAYRDTRTHRPYRRHWWRASNDYQPGYSSSSTCTREEYREEYIPGTANNPGYVKRWHDTIDVPCNPVSTRPTVIRERTPSPDGNECIEGSVLGGILGGGAAAALSRGDGRWWAIPLGVVGGSVIGCDIDGG